MKISDHDLSQRTFVVAEVGINPEGDIGVAKELIQKAVLAGVDGVKFQTFCPEKLFLSTDRDRLERFRRFAFREDDFLELASYTKELGLIFLSTPFYLEAVDLLDPVVPAFKIASGDITFAALLEYVASKGKPILLSTGMSTAEEVSQAIEIIRKANPRIIEEEKLLLLHCVGSYPARLEEANLRSIPFLREVFHLPVGYSDHTLGIEASLWAVVLGACLIEKHFTLDNSRRTHLDHQLSANPEDMKRLVEKIRLVEKSLGEYKKELLEGELANRKAMRRSLVAERDIPSGSIITEDVLTALRPEKGIPAYLLKEVIGKRCRRNVTKGEILSEQDIEGF